MLVCFTSCCFGIQFVSWGVGFCFLLVWVGLIWLDQVLSFVLFVLIRSLGFFGLVCLLVCCYLPRSVFVFWPTSWIEQWSWLWQKLLLKRQLLNALNNRNHRSSSHFLMLSQWTEYEESPIVAIYFDKYKTKNKLQNPEIAQDVSFHPPKIRWKSVPSSVFPSFLSKFKCPKFPTFSLFFQWLKIHRTTAHHGAWDLNIELGYMSSWLIGIQPLHCCSFPRHLQ